MAREIEYGFNAVGNFRLLNFATGGYRCACRECGKEFTGDKRAVQCLACALKAVEAKFTAQNTPKAPCCTSCNSERVTVICNKCGFKHCM